MFICKLLKMGSLQGHNNSVTQQSLWWVTQDEFHPSRATLPMVGCSGSDSLEWWRKSQSLKVSPGTKTAFPSLTSSEGAQIWEPSQALAASAHTDGLYPSAAISWQSLAAEMATFLAETPILFHVLTRVADFEAFSVVGMIRGPAEIDSVPAAGDGQRG